MSLAKVGLVTLLAGGISIGAAIFGEHWVSDTPLGEQHQHHARAGIQTLPDFRLLDLDGHEITSSTWAGKVIVINYWATWCPPCVRELPMLIAAQQSFADAGVQIVGIAVDRTEDVHRFVADYPVNFPILIATPEAIALSKRLGNRIEGLPFTAIFDDRGRQVFSRIGEVGATELHARLEAILGDTPSSDRPAN